MDKKAAKFRSGKAKSLRNLPVKALKAKGVKGGFTAVEHGATEKKGTNSVPYLEVKMKDVITSS
jgi:hypothetical protein